MAHTAYPVTADVSAVLTAAGQSVGTVDVAAILAATIAEWELVTGWRPFLAEATASTRYYDYPRNGYLLLPGYATITGVTTGVTYNQTTGAVIAGTAIVENVDYRPVYWRNGDTTSPIVALQFLRYVGGAAYRSISVTGKLGYTTDIPNDAWQALLDGAAARAYGSTSMANNDGISKMSIGGRTIEFNGADATTWNDSFSSVAMAYKRGGIV